MSADLQPLPAEIERVLRPYQVSPARQLYRALTHGGEIWGYPGAADLSSVGVGKTYMDLAAALALGLPVGVICPVVGKDGWQAAFSAFGAQPAFIETYEAIRGNFRKHIAFQAGGEFYWKGGHSLILDEFQAGRNPDSLTTLCVEGILRQHIPTIAASATLAISPAELYVAGQLTGLHKGGDSWLHFLAAHGCFYDESEQKWKFNNRLHHLHSIHSRLIPERGCRVTKDMLGEQPGTTIRVLKIEVPEGPEINKAWNEANELVQRLKDQGQPDWYVTNARRAAYTACWKRCELALVPFVAERIKADLEAGNSVVAFFSFTEARLAMGKLLNRKEGFYGGQSAKARSYYMKEFQANRIHVLLNQIKAGGASVSLHDIHGERPRVSYIFPSSNPVAMAQAPGRIDRAGGQSHSLQWVPCVSGTLSERMVEQSARKMMKMNALNDGAKPVEIFA